MSTSLEGAMSETERVMRSLLGQSVGEAEALVRKHPVPQRQGGPITPQEEGDGRTAAEKEAARLRKAAEDAKAGVVGKPADEPEEELSPDVSMNLRQGLFDISTINAQLLNAGPGKILELMQTPFQQEKV